MSEQWYIARNDKKHGPFTAAKLKELAAQGRLFPTDMLLKEGMQKWVAASSVKGLIPAAHAIPAAAMPLAKPGKSSAASVSGRKEPATASERDVSTTSGQEKVDRVGSYIFGALLFLFFVGVFVFAPSTLPEFKQRMLAISCALLAGIFALFMSGRFGIHITGLKSPLGKIALRAGGGTGVFTLVLVWWLSPLAPVGLEKKLDDIRSDTTAIRADTTAIKQNVDGIGKLGGLIKNPGSPADYYHNARVHELGGNFAEAFVAYRKYATFNQELMDPYLSYLRLLKTQEGFTAAVKELNALAKKYPQNRAVLLTRALLSAGDDRASQLEAFVKQHGDFGPSYLYLANAYSADEMPNQSSVAVNKERLYLQKFLDQDKSGNVLKYFLDKKQAEELIESAKARLNKSSETTPESFISYDNGEGFIHISDSQVKDVFYSFNGANWLPGKHKPIGLGGRTFSACNLNLKYDMGENADTIRKWRDARLREDFDATVAILVKYVDNKGRESTAVKLKPFPVKNLLSSQFRRNVLDFSSQTLEELHFRLIALHATSNVTKLILTGSKFGNGYLKHLSGCAARWNLGLIVRLDRSSISDDGLQYIGAWEHCSELYLGKTSISDTGLNQLAQLHKLKLLDVTNTKVTEAGAAELAKKLPKCTIVATEQAHNPDKLNWSGRTLSEDDFKKLKSTTAIREIVLSNATFSEQHLKYVPFQGRSLTRLSLANTKVTDEGLKWLSFHELEELNLAGTQITDATLARIGQFPPLSLRSIDLSNTKVTDEGLKRLARSAFFKPKTIVLTGTKVTVKGVELIRNKWGKSCTITYP